MYIPRYQVVSLEKTGVRIEIFQHHSAHWTGWPCRGEASYRDQFGGKGMIPGN